MELLVLFPGSSRSFRQNPENGNHIDTVSHSTALPPFSVVFTGTEQRANGLAPAKSCFLALDIVLHRLRHQKPSSLPWFLCPPNQSEHRLHRPRCPGHAPTFGGSELWVRAAWAPTVTALAGLRQVCISACQVLFLAFSGNTYLLRMLFPYRWFGGNQSLFFCFRPTCCTFDLLVSAVRSLVGPIRLVPVQRCETKTLRDPTVNF